MLVCNNGRRGYSKECRYSPWDILEFEQRVLTRVREVDLPSVFGSEQSERVELLRMQLVATQGKLADTESRLNHLVAVLERGVEVAPIVARIRQLQAELDILTKENVIRAKEDQLVREAMDTAESKQRSVVELMNVIHDREVRLKLKQQLRGLIERIDVDLVKKSMVVFYIGQRPRMNVITPDVPPPMFKNAR